MELDDIIRSIQESLGDQSMPRRVRQALQAVVEDLGREDQDLAMRVTTAVYELDEIANDVNIPMHVKTILWDIISDLEALKG